MCELATMIADGTALLSTALSVTQQLRQADSQRSDDNFLAARQAQARYYETAAAHPGDRQDVLVLTPIRHPRPEPSGLKP